MRIVSLSSRLQWAFRGTVLPGALATGDVDNDGCKEFVVGSVQGELAIFRGRGGCGSWRFSEDQIEPEFDCWDAVIRGEIPPECAAATANNEVKRQHDNWANRNGEALSAGEILEMLDGSAMYPKSTQDSRNASGDEGDGAVRHNWDPDYNGHIKWEDALDLERDGRKPWVIGQKLGTISSVVVADISNCGHNSVVVINGEGKCHVFDYPFKRRLHPDPVKRRRQRNHFRRFSQHRFFAASPSQHPSEDLSNQQQHPDKRRFPSATQRTKNTMDTPVDNRASEDYTKMQRRSYRDMTAKTEPVSALSNTDDDMSTTPLPGFGWAQTNSISTPALRQYNPTSTITSPTEGVYDKGAASNPHIPKEKEASGVNHNTAGSVVSSTGIHFNEMDITNSSARHHQQKSRVVSGASNQHHSHEHDCSQEAGFQELGLDMLGTSNLSSQTDPPLTILDKRKVTSRDFANSDQQQIVSSTSAHSAGKINSAAVAAAAASSGSPYAKQQQLDLLASELSGRESHNDGLHEIDSMLDLESEEGYMDYILDDIGNDFPLLDHDVATNIENIWGANLGKKSGDWFPFVLDSPDMSFDIPTNVEHAMVADINNDGLNELVLTATDGFVYVFRIDSVIKRTSKPTLASLGIFSNIPTTAHTSANITGHGSPYLSMSAPRSPEGSDLDFDRMYRHKTRKRSNTETRKTNIGKESTAVGYPDAESDMGLVNHLLKSIKDVSSSSSGRNTADKEREDATQVFPKLPSIKAEDVGHAQTAVADRKSTNSRPASLTSRMRDSIGGIISGWDVTKRSSPSCNHTAPPSITHSLVHTSNNSGTSTNNHSRRPSANDEMGNVGETFSNPPPPPPANGLDGGNGKFQRTRINSICVGGALEVLEEMPERPSLELEGEHQDTEPNEEALAVAANNVFSSTVQDPGYWQRRRISSTSNSRGHSRQGSIGKTSIAGLPSQTSRIHSRHGSVSSISGSSKNRTTTGNESGTDQDLLSVAGGVSRRGSLGSGGIHTREGSIGRIHTTNSSSNANIAGNSSSALAADPVEVTVSARGSFSKPSDEDQQQKQQRRLSTPQYADMEDNSSIISQVTERLAKLGFNTTRPWRDSNEESSKVDNADEDDEASAAHQSLPSVSTIQKRQQRPFISVSDFMGGSDSSFQLPPPRNVVDWPATSAEKICTWFLDNIPGNVSVISAPADAFDLNAENVQSEDGNESSYSSECSCSSCACSQSLSDSESDEPASDIRLLTSSTTKSNFSTDKDRSDNQAAAAVAAATETASKAGVKLPQPLELGGSGSADIGVSTKEEGSCSINPDELVSEEKVMEDIAKDEKRKKKEQQRFLILSKPGGRFVPIDTKLGSILSTVEPPEPPLSALTGGNNAHLMNLVAKKPLRKFQMALTAAGLPYPQQLSAGMLDYSMRSGASYLGHSPSWQCNSLSWNQRLQIASYNSLGDGTKSPPASGNTDVYLSYLKPGQQTQTQPKTTTEQRAISQFPSNDSLKHSTGETGDRLMNLKPSHSSIESESSNKSNHKSRNRVSADSVQSQGFQGPSPLNPGQSSTGSVTPSTTYGFHYANASRYERHNLGYAGLRGYIGNGISRLRTAGNWDAGKSGMIRGGGSTEIGVNSGRLSGHYTPLSSVQMPQRGQSAGVSQEGVKRKGDGVGSAGVMPREPAIVYSSSVVLTVPIRDHQSNVVSVPAQPRNSSASPQLTKMALHFNNPSLTKWSSYKEGSVLGTIKDQDSVSLVGTDKLPHATSTRRNSSASTTNIPPLSSRAFAAEEPLTNELPSQPVTALAEPKEGPANVSAFNPMREAFTSPHIDETNIRSFWQNARPSSLRSPSSLDTGGNSIGQLLSKDTQDVEEETKEEEEIEEAPQPMELDVATYMVGGVTGGRRVQRILRGIGDQQPEDGSATMEDLNADAFDDSTGDDDLNELVSLVTMDGIISCHDPVRKLTHYVGLSTKDPVLGIWKTKMHEEICQPSPLETMLLDGTVNMEPEFANRLLSSTPSKQIYRRVGLSARELLPAARYSVHIEGLVNVVNQFEGYRRRVARQQQRRYRIGKGKVISAGGKIRKNYGLGVGVDKILAQDNSSTNSSQARLDDSEMITELTRRQVLSRGNAKYGANGARLRENLNRYRRASRAAARHLNNKIRDLTAAEGGVDGDTVSAMSSVPPSQSINNNSNNNVSTSQVEKGKGVDSSGDILFKDLVDGAESQGAETSAAAVSSSYGTSPKISRSVDSNGNIQMSAQVPPPPKTNRHINNNPSQMMSKELSMDIATALKGWYGENKGDYRRNLRVADHLVVSTWRGTTYFVDVGTMLDIAHYNELFTHKWDSKLAERVESAMALATITNPDTAASDKDTGGETSSQIMNTIYGHLGEFGDIRGLVSRLRGNASVVQFKFQDMVSAFLADTYAPTTGGPNVPCLFYVDYKDRIWAYYHLDEIAEMDDVYGATWFRDELDSLHTPASRQKSLEIGVDFCNYDKPFSVVDMAYRRINTDPWIPAPSEDEFKGLVSYDDRSYPYSTRTWRKRHSATNKKTEDKDDGENTSQLHFDKRRSYCDDSVHTPSENSTQPFQTWANANVAGRFHDSYLPGPYLCPIWSDLGSVDLYDVGACNLLELATPELLSVKDVFCKDLGIDPSAVNQHIDLATIPGLANWVRGHLYSI